MNLFNSKSGRILFSNNQCQYATTNAASVVNGVSQINIGFQNLIFHVASHVYDYACDREKDVESCKVSKNVRQN